MCNGVLFLYTQSENIKLNPTINAACASDVDLYCRDVSAGAGKVCLVCISCVCGRIFVAGVGVFEEALPPVNLTMCCCN